VELPKDAADAVTARLAGVSHELGVEVMLRRTEADVL